MKYQESQVVNPTEIMDRKEKEFLDENPAHLQDSKRPAQFVSYLDPEIYEEELLKKRERKAEFKKVEEEEAKKKKKQEQLAAPRIGRLNGSGTYAQYIMQNTIKNTMRDQDPREVLLSRAEETQKNPLFVQKAYEATQPKTVFNTGE
mmetsp:Transcript_2117/g.3172  ORF Transcript_2117/g.3172 Transcript_2117/m.3172 type:complete len:147 (+) Transcript_2117:303-743(+)|eukprot:CAMPEP_0170511748 /NCGR_PEP_ID=MMETSP0208-20121228/66472_1 /TAXON_ID=197538 /ORGANISM="Strombidium inclinatum, Strain S3" /LENGTH=146 /DNA_ID=CAMNT_0010795311 /DNA_START=1152 /DNA_END=1592 /DNA_ORIENTATION=+